MAKFEIPDGWSVQRQFGGRRYARNWAVRALRADIDAYRATGAETDKPSFIGMRVRWNKVKHTECVDAENGEVWWPEISKEASAWNRHQSRSGKRTGSSVGFPRSAKKGRDTDRVTFTPWAIRIEPDRRHATLPRIGCVANDRGEILVRVPHTRALEKALKELRHLSRRKSRRNRESGRYIETTQQISRLHRRVAGIRGHHMHCLTTDLAKTHGEIVADRLDAAGMRQQKGLTGTRACHRGLSGSALGDHRRQLGYKTSWFGSRLTIANRWYPSSKTCHVCGRVQAIGWGTTHQRDDNREPASKPGNNPGTGCGSREP